jgi:Zn finger protein HypA/HybF involved in hydrogenase expression
VLQDRIECRRCGYALRKEDGRPLKPDDSIPQAQQPKQKQRGYYEPREKLLATYGKSYVGELDRWADAAYSTALSHVHREEWEEAVKAFYRAIDAQPDFVDAHLWIARIINDPPVQRDHLTTVLAHQPNNIDALRELMILDGKLSPDAPTDSYAEPEVRAAGGAVSAKIQNLRCPRCGSNTMTVDDSTGLGECASCGFIDEDGAGQRADGEGSLAMALLERRSQPVIWQVGERLLQCNSCGAQRTIPARKLSDRCPFCDSNQVIESDALASFQQPDGLIPFRVDKKQAGEAIKARLGGWQERMKGWLDNNKVDRATLDGMYLPYWMFDASVDVRKTITRDATYSQDSRNHFSAADAYQTTLTPDAINNVAVFAATSPKPLLTEKLGAFDPGVMVAYEPKLLAKYPAQLYSIDFDKASLMARKKIGEALRAKHAEPAGQNVKIAISSLVTHMSFQLVLVPVWIATLYEADGDIRTALVNGQTAQVALGKAVKPKN